jgi:hypothetical protein
MFASARLAVVDYPNIHGTMETFFVLAAPPPPTRVEMNAV